MLYQLYENGAATDSYVSEHVEELLRQERAPPGDAEGISDVFGKPRPPGGWRRCSAS